MPALRAEAIARTESASCSSRSAMTLAARRRRRRCQPTTADTAAATPTIGPATTRPPIPTRAATPATRALPGTAIRIVDRAAGQPDSVLPRRMDLDPRSASQAARPSTTTMRPLKRRPRARRASHRRPHRDRRAWRRSAAPCRTLRTHRTAFTRAEAEQRGHHRFPAVGSFDGRDLPDDPPAVAQARQVHHDVDGRRHLVADVGGRQVDVGHHGHRLQPPEQMPGGVRVRGRERPFVSGVHRLQHVERLAAADLADDDPIWSHAERVAHQVANRHLALALRRWPGVLRGRPRAVSRGGARRRPRW